MKEGTATTTPPLEPARVNYRHLPEEALQQLVEANKRIYTEHFDPDFLKSLNEAVVDMLNIYFRPVFVGFDEMPLRSNPDRPLIYACNHSGMAFPWDAIIFGAGIFRKHGYQMERLFRPLSAPALSASSLMNPFMVKDMWKRVGSIDATGLNFETMMQYPDANLLVYPEGIPGIGKGFNRRYQLQTFSTSMIRMAIKHRTDIIGISCVNGEYINPYSYASRRINKLINKLGIPYLPVAVHTPLLLFLPWMFYYALPAKLTYVRGNTYKPYEMAGGRSLEELTVEEVRRIRDDIQADMQAQLTQSVAQYGQKPYDWREFGRSLRQHWRKLPYWTPIGWPALFTEFERRYQRETPPPKDVTQGWFRFWRIVARNPIILAYYVPILGWIPLLYKGLRDRRKVRPWQGPQDGERPLAV
ncbi:MAG: hypothetical protein OHK0039_20450 [Bacteroidia bacterium]